MQSSAEEMNPGQLRLYLYYNQKSCDRTLRLKSNSLLSICFDSDRFKSNVSRSDEFPAISRAKFGATGRGVVAGIVPDDVPGVLRWNERGICSVREYGTGAG